MNVYEYISAPEDESRSTHSHRRRLLRHIRTIGCIGDSSPPASLNRGTRGKTRSTTTC